ncbi:MAG: hypothetical protein JEZ12_03940 [Desulfobacterium sp.]|nr:hypothetical protein [Desulfobacterium sp.]
MSPIDPGETGQPHCREGRRGSLAPPFKTIAWNGISLAVPGAWDLGTLGENHLLFGENREPRLEITWTEGPARGSFENQMNRFISRVQKRLGITVSPLSIPFGSVTPDSPVSVAGFFWKSASSRGRGGLVRCKGCKRIAMLRFFDRCESLSDTLMETVVGSYKDTCPGKSCSWQVFGLDLLTPGGFSLYRYSFRPGAFSMAFKAPGQEMTVYSWGPAAFLLLDSGLAGFAGQRINLPDKTPWATEEGGRPCLVWEWQRFPWSFGFLNPHERFRICHDQTLNRLIGFKRVFNHRGGRKPMEGSIICHDITG